MSKKEKITKANKLKKKLIITSALTAVLIAGSLGFVSVSQAQGQPNGIWDILTDEQKEQVEQMKQEKEAEKEDLEQAIKNGDYTKWKEIIESKPKITDYITEDNFSQYSEMHSLMQEEKFDEAQEIREELGLPMNMEGIGMKGPGRHVGRQMGGDPTESRVQ